MGYFNPHLVTAIHNVITVFVTVLYNMYSSHYNHLTGK